MTNFEMLKELSLEEMAAFLAHERFNLAKPVFEAAGYGLTEETVYFVLLRWLKQETEV